MTSTAWHQSSAHCAATLQRLLSVCHSTCFSVHHNPQDSFFQQSFACIANTSKFCYFRVAMKVQWDMSSPAVGYLINNLHVTLLSLGSELSSTVGLIPKTTNSHWHFMSIVRRHLIILNLYSWPCQTNFLKIIMMMMIRTVINMLTAGQGWKKTYVFRFQCRKTGHKIMTQKFTKNISYMIHPSSCTSFMAMCRL